MGLFNDLVLKPGEVTIFGFTPNLDGLLILSGEIDSQKASYKGSRGWLRNIKINGQSVNVSELIETIMDCGFQHHYPLVYGNLTEAANELAVFLDIPVIEAKPYRNYLRRS